MIESQLDELVRRTLEQEEFADCQLIELKLGKSNAIEIIADADSGMSLEMCRNLSRAIEEKIDAVQLLGEDYTIEVSSPGVERPLKFLRQYNKHIGRTLDITLNDAALTHIEGILKSVEADNITVSFNTERKEGKKKIKETHVQEIPFAQIKKTVVVISFK